MQQLLNVISLILYLPNLLLFIFLSLSFIIFSIIAIFVVRRVIPLKLRIDNDAVIGSISSLISIIYGVLVGLTALYLINNISYTADAVLREANAVADLHRDTKWLKEPVHTQVHQQVINYLNLVINKEWPMMREGKKIGLEGNLIINNITDALVSYTLQTPGESILIQDSFGEIKSLYDARQQRIHMSYSVLNSEMWTVIFIGTILTIMINFLYGMHFYLHLITASAVAFMAASMIFLLITLDRPFQGEFVIEPDAFRAVLTFIEKYSDIGTTQNSPQQQR